MEKSIFDLWVSVDWCLSGLQRELFTRKEGTAASLTEAEGMIASCLAEADSKTHFHHFLIREVPLGRRCPNETCLSSYLYDKKGVRVDQRTFSTIPEDEGVFLGRTPDQIRFRVGDVVEFGYGRQLRLGTVIGIPPSEERAAQINNNPKGIHLDDTDDVYTVLFAKGCHQHVDAMNVFKYSYRLLPAEERRLEKDYNDYVTMPARLEILNTTARAQLTDFFERHGLKGNIQGINRLEEMFGITLELPDGPKELSVKSEKVIKHMDRVCCTLARFAGIKVEGRGYRINTSGSGNLYF